MALHSRASFDAFEWNSDNDSTNNDHLRDLGYLYGNVQAEKAEIDLWHGVVIDDDIFAKYEKVKKVKKKLKKKQRKGKKRELSGSSNSAIQIILAVSKFINKKYAFAWINLGCLPFAAVHRPVATVAVLRLVQSVARYSPTRKKP